MNILSSHTGDYPQPYAAGAAQTLQRPSSLTEQLQRRRTQAESELTRLNAVIAALEAHPETLKILELLSQV